MNVSIAVNAFHQIEIYTHIRKESTLDKNINVSTAVKTLPQRAI